MDFVMNPKNINQMNIKIRFSFMVIKNNWSGKK
jgi:hypothetical protein